MLQSNLPREAQTGPIFHPDVGTHAYVAWLNSQQELDALLGMVFAIPGETERSERYLRARRLKVERDAPPPWSVNVQEAMLSWQVAMRASAAELYLQDALTFLAVYAPEFIESRESKQDWDYARIRAASDQDDVLWTFCNSWARSFVSDGGPRRWAASLEASGLGKFATEEVSILELMWGYRHMCVHHGGRLTREFLIRHGDNAKSLVETGFDVGTMKVWAHTTSRFVASVERGVVGRLRAYLGEELIAERERLELVRQFTSWDQSYEETCNRETEDEAETRAAASFRVFEEESALIEELFS